MDFLPAELSQYAESHSQEEPDLLKRLNRETHATILKPRMLSGHLQGRFLSFWSKMLQPTLIVEIGTYTGYSALCLAEGLSKTGKIITIEVNEELKAIAEKYFKESTYASQIEPIIGDASSIIPTLPNEIDLVFIDADKKNYANYYQLVLNKLKKGGIIIADNVLWSGKVTGQGKIDADTQTLLDFNKMVQDDKRVENLLLPVRDGLMIARKL
ncbi:MAG: O-methyltransferase [Bacteroidota bacterium]